MNVAQGNLRLSACGLFTRIIVTHVSIRTSDTSSRPYDPPSQAYRTLLYRTPTSLSTLVSSHSDSHHSNSTLENACAATPQSVVEVCLSEVGAPQASVYRLAPLNLPRRPTRPVSYYAFFKGWLLLSQPPGCFCLPTSFSTERQFWDLSCGSGLFPFSRRTFAPAVCLPCSHVSVFGVCHGLLSRDDPLAITVLYPRE